MSIIIADASPLIAFATIGRLELLKQLYGEVVIPLAVEQELKLNSDMPGSKRLKQAIEEDWLTILTVSKKPSTNESLRQLLHLLDPGESEAILLTESLPPSDYRFLLIDERKGRKIAKKRGIKIAGSGAVLLAAKKKGYIQSVKSELDAMTENGYRLSDGLRQRLLGLAGE